MKWIAIALCVYSVAWPSQSAPKQGTVIAVASPLAGGSISGGGTYKAHTLITLVASPAPNWTFVQWQDGLNTPIRTYLVPVGTSRFVANFQTNVPPDHGTISLVSEPSNGGTTTGAGTYIVGQSVTITAKPVPNWTFSQWQDGNITSTRLVVVPNGSVLYAATFITNPISPVFTNAFLYWTPSTTTNILSYVLSYGVAPHNYTNSISTTATNASIAQVDCALTYYASVVAVTGQGQAGSPSCEVAFKCPNPSSCQ